MPLNINTVGSIGIGSSSSGSCYVSEPNIAEQLKLSYGSVTVDMNSIKYTDPLISNTNSSITNENLAIPQICFKDSYYGFQRHYNTYNCNVYKCTLNADGSITRTVVTTVYQIYDNSWFVCGDYMWFITEDSKIYRYDGNTCTVSMTLPKMYVSAAPLQSYLNSIPMNTACTNVLIVYKFYGQLDYGGYSILKVSPDGYIINASFGVDPNNATVISKIMHDYDDYIYFVNEDKMIVAEIGQDMNKTNYPGTITWKEYKVTFTEKSVNGVLTYPCTRTLVKTILPKKTLTYNRCVISACNIIGNTGNVFLTASSFYSSICMMIECFYQIVISEDGSYSVQVKNNSQNIGRSFTISHYEDDSDFVSIACRMLNDKLMLYTTAYDSKAGWTTYQLSCTYTASNSGNSYCIFTGPFVKGDTIITSTDITHISNSSTIDIDYDGHKYVIPEDSTYTINVKTLDDLKTPPMVILTSEGHLLHLQLQENVSGSKDYANLISGMKVNKKTIGISGNQDITSYKENDRYTITL